MHTEVTISSVSRLWSEFSMLHRWCPRVLVIVMTACLCSCGGTVETLLRCTSPDGRLDAIFYWVYGGGAAGWASFGVTIQPTGEALTADRFVFSMRHGYHVRLRWSSPDALIVEYPDRAAVDAQLAQYDVPQGFLGRTLETVSISYLPSKTVPDGQLEGGTQCVGRPDRPPPR